MNNVMTKKWMKRRPSRGVAMVEAGILAPIFAMMMMMTVYLGGVYEAKYRSFMKERYRTWSYGSSGCTNNPPDSSPGAEVVPPQNPPSDPCNTATDTGSAKSSMFMAQAYDEETWSYAPTLKFNNGQVKTVRTDGYMVCNEKQVPAGIGSIFSQMGSELGQLFGSVQGGNGQCGAGTGP